MTTLADTLVACLSRAAGRFREHRLDAQANTLERLALEAHQPCVVAVVGRVKSGKSSFVNALLGEDLAQVGTTETTATINYFRYGTPNPAKPVRCHWLGGAVTEEDKGFLDALQGNDEATLRRAEGIDYLEYLLPNPKLQAFTLVDTPGTSAVVDEHQNRTAEFLKLAGQLRERQAAETERLGSAADAIIYMIGQVARTDEREFLEEFGQATGGQSRAFNAIGVMAKIDMQFDPTQLATRPAELAAKIGRQLRDELNVVLPVSAGIERALQQLTAGAEPVLPHFIATLRRIPPARLAMLLDSQDFFCKQEYAALFADCVVTLAERQSLVGNLPWTVFTTLARVAATADMHEAEVVERLRGIAGFAPLRSLLDRHFFQRGQTLRAYRIVCDARKLIQELQFTLLPKVRRRARENRQLAERFVRFIRGNPADPAVAAELEAFVHKHLPGEEQSADLEKLWRQLDGDFSRLFHDLDAHNADFEALQALEDQPDAFNPAELDELRALLGLYGLDSCSRLGAHHVDIGFIGSRQQYWNSAQLRAVQGKVRQVVAERAFSRYGILLESLQNGPVGAKLQFDDI